VRRAAVLLLLTGCPEGVPGAASSAASAAPTASSAASAAPTASSPPTASAPASARPPARLRISREQARKSGSVPPLPDVGLVIEGIWEGFTANLRPQAGTYLSLGASPRSGPEWIQFVIRGYHDADATAAGVDEVFRAWNAEVRLYDAVTTGAEAEVTLAGAPRPAVAFTVPTGIWCVALVRSPREAREGLAVMVGVASAAGTEPVCAPLLAHERMAPLIGSLQVE
jgi:hypothetical protein